MTDSQSLDILAAVTLSGLFAVMVRAVRRGLGDIVLHGYEKTDKKK